MNEFIMPAAYVGTDAGIAAFISGLQDFNYEKFELSIDGSNFITVTHRKDDISSTTHHFFHDLTEWKVYKVYARITIAGDILTTECMMVARQQQQPTSPQARNLAVHRGGGMSKEPAAPQARYQNNGNS